MDPVSAHALARLHARRWICALAGVTLVLIALAHLPLFLAGEPFSPDVLFLAVPNAHFLGEQLRAGHLPLWDPHVLGGHPFLAELQTQVLYPPSILWVLGDPRRWMGAFLALHLVFGAAGVFVLGRALRLRPEACAAMALAFGLSPLLVEHYQHPNLLCGLCWLPWIWMAARLLVRRPTGLKAASLALLWACAILAGAPELVLFGGFAAAWIARRRLGWLVLGLGAGTLLAAAAWLPFLELLRHSDRALGVAFSTATHFELHRIELADLIAPFAEYAEGPGLHAHYFAQLFLGATPVAFALAARRRGWLVIAGLLLLLALGGESPLFRALWMVLPPLRAVRSPIKFASLLAVLVAVMTGRGFQRWSVYGGARTGWLVLVFGMLALVGLAMGGLAGSAAPWAASAAWSGAAAAVLLATRLLSHPHSRRLAALGVATVELVAFNLGVSRAVLHAGPECAEVPELSSRGRVLFDVGGGIQRPRDWPALCALGWPNRNMLGDFGTIDGFVAPAPGPIHQLLNENLPAVARAYQPSVVVLADDVDRGKYPPGAPFMKRGRYTAYRIAPAARAWLQTAGARLPLEPERVRADSLAFALPGLAGELTLLDTAFPGWTARVDDRPAAVGTRDGVQVIEIPEGARHLEVTYAPASFAWGIGLSVLGLTACLALAAADLRRVRSRRFSL